MLEDLLAQQSERVLAETVLRENAAKIASTFARIHAPNEFDLVVVDDGLTIVRRGGGNVNLDEMSSGQRAAYALSLFLAMNERLRSGPKVLLLDDPVAHVDDIKHVVAARSSARRRVGLASGKYSLRQPTPRSELCFDRKFRFLGEKICNRSS